MRKPRKRGFFMALLPLIYAPVRFFLDFLRETPDHGGDVRYYGLTPGQYGSILFFLVGIVIAVRIARRPEATLMLPGATLPTAETAAGLRQERIRAQAALALRPGSKCISRRTRADRARPQPRLTDVRRRW